MRIHQKLTAAFLLVTITLLGFGSALAAPAVQALPPCTADLTTGKVSGTVVFVDPATGLVTIEKLDGTQCTVNVSIDETHPITLLLGMYFGDFNTDSLEEALASSQGCALFDAATSTWAWADCTVTGAVPVRVTGVNPNGTFIAEVVEDGTLIPALNVGDPAVVTQLNGALAALSVEWALELDGSLQQVSDQIAALHDSGMGFGVIVKLFAIAQASQEGCVDDGDPLTTCGVSVEDLVLQFQGGAGMGQLFKEYGKPDKLGVGHVRQELSGKEKNNNGNGNQPGDTFTPPGLEKKENKAPKDNQLKGICKAVTKGGKAKGKAPVTCP